MTHHHHAAGFLALVEEARPRVKEISVAEYGARLMRHREVNFAGMPRDHLKQRPRAVLAERAGQDHRFSSGFLHESGQIGIQHQGSLRIVRSIEDDRPSPDRYPLPTTRPARVPETGSHDLPGEPPARRQQACDQRGGGRVPALIIALQIGGWVPGQFVAKHVAHGRDGRLPFRGDGPDDGLGLRRHPAQHDRAPRLDDTRLFGRDQFDAVAEHVAMIEPDRRDRRHLRLHHVGGVKPSAEAHLDHGQIDLAPRELQDSHGGHELEETRKIVRICPALPFRHRLQLVHVGDDLRFAQQLPVDLDAFPEFHQMRRSVEPGAPAGRVQDRVEHRGHRPLAVGAGDMNDRVAPLRMPQRLDQQPHPVDTELRPLGLEAEQVFPNRGVSRQWPGGLHERARVQHARTPASRCLLPAGA